jgi:hypothetical protein
VWSHENDVTVFDSTIEMLRLVSVRQQDAVLARRNVRRRLGRHLALLFDPEKEMGLNFHLTSEGIE